MPVLKVKNDNGVWQDIATANTHEHTMSDITDLPASLVNDVEALKDKVGADSVAYQVAVAMETMEGNVYEHPPTHPANMITGLADVAISGNYNDLVNLPTISEQVQADWNQTDSTQPDYIKNKPEDELPVVTTSDNGKILGIVNGAWNKISLPEPENGLPDVTTSDNGKFLGVSNGVWTTVDAPECSGSASGGSLPEVTIDDNGKVLGVVDGTWQKMDVEVSGGGSGGSSVQSDWNQSDETAPDYIKNRPFYVGGTAMTEVLPTTDIPFNYDENWGCYAFTIPPTQEQLSAWQSDWSVAELTWDGTTYNCEPQYFMGIKCIGNVDLFNGVGNNGMPFGMLVADASMMGEDTCVIMSLFDIPAEPYPMLMHNVAVSLGLQGVTTLDSKFLGDVPWEKVTDKPFDEFAAGTVVTEETVTIGDYDDITTLRKLDSNLLIDGATYSVIFDGNEYSGVCEYIESDNRMQIFIYNSDNLNIASVVCVQQLAALITESEELFPSGTAMDVKIVLTSDTIKKIDAKFIPEIEALPEVTTEDNGKIISVVDGAWTVIEKPVDLPSVTTSDAGKFLRVSADGLWVATTVLNSEEVKF